MRMLSVIVSLIFITLLDVGTAHYVIILEKAAICDPNSKIFVNYTYTPKTNKGDGYVEFLEKIETNSNIRVSVAVQHTGVQGSEVINSYHTMNNTKMDYCVFVHSDLLYVPYVREFFPFEKSCPTNKGIYTFQKSMLFLKRNLPYPTGCWKIRSRMEKNGKLFACVYVIVQFLPSLNSERIKCS